MPSGLDFPSNNASNSDIRLIWDSTNLLPRENHTAIWRYKPRQQTQYYALAWHSPNGGLQDGLIIIVLDYSLQRILLLQFQLVYYQELIHFQHNQLNLDRQFQCQY